MLTNTTLHMGAYNRIFNDIENFDGVTIVGFSQENRVLKATSGTFNTDKRTELKLDESSDCFKDCLFAFRTLIFGAIIMYKLTGIRDIKPKVATLAVCLFLISKNHVENGQFSGFTLSDLELQDKEIFLQEMLMSFGVEDEIIELACDYQELNIFTKEPKAMKIMKAVKLLMKNLCKEMSEDDFRLLEKGIVMLGEKSRYLFTHVGNLVKSMAGVVAESPIPIAGNKAGVAVGNIAGVEIGSFIAGAQVSNIANAPVSIIVGAEVGSLIYINSDQFRSKLN